MTACMRATVVLMVAFVGMPVSHSIVSAQEEPAQSDTTKPDPTPPVELTTVSGKRIDIILDGLQYPSGLAIQPETGTIFISESGKGQILRVESGTAVPAVIEFPLAPSALDPNIQLGPLGLLFWDRNTLLVGCNGREMGEATLRWIELPESAEPAEPVKAEAAKHVQRVTAGETSTSSPALLYSLVSSLDGIYGSVAGDENQAWIIEQKRDSDVTATLDEFIDVGESIQTLRPGGLTISPHGYLVVGTIGEWEAPNDAIIAFLDTTTKKLLMRLETGLQDISAVAYSPRRQMYVLDMSISQPDEGGLYKVVADSKSPSGMKTKKIAALAHPTSMAFDMDGALYVTIAGKVDQQGNRQGYLLKIPSDENL